MDKVLISFASIPCALISPTTACAARAFSRAASAAFGRSVSTPIEIVAMSGTTSVLATPVVVMEGTESFKDG